MATAPFFYNRRGTQINFASGDDRYHHGGSMDDYQATAMSGRQSRIAGTLRPWSSFFGATPAIHDHQYRRNRDIITMRQSRCHRVMREMIVRAGRITYYRPLIIDIAYSPKYSHFRRERRNATLIFILHMLMRLPPKWHCQ